MHGRVAAGRPSSCNVDGREVGMASRGLIVGLVALVSFGLVRPTFALTEEELKRYGFSGGISGYVNDTNRYTTGNRGYSPSRIPSPVVPKLDPERRVPTLPGVQPRVLHQEARPTPGEEGPTQVYRHSRASEIEGSFKEVENFFFNPAKINRPFQTLAGMGLTGLAEMPSAEIPKKGFAVFQAGAEYTRYSEAFDERLPSNQRIEQWRFPFTYSVVPMDDLEASVKFTMVNEEAFDFPLPLPTSYTLTGLQDVTLQAKYRFVENPSKRFSIAAGLGIDVAYEKNVTRLGSNGVDYRLFLAATRRSKNYGLHLTGGVVFPNGEDRTSSGVPDISFFSLGLDFFPSERMAALLEFSYKDRAYSGSSLDAIVGLKYQVNPGWHVDVGVPVAISNSMPQGYRDRVFLRGQWRL